MEFFKESEKIEAESTRKFRTRNQVQAAMALMLFSKNENFFDDSHAWIKENGEVVRQIFDELVIENPNLIDEWDPEHPTEGESKDRIEINPARTKIIEMIKDRMKKTKGDELDRAA
jgi:hypothetical protein